MLTRGETTETIPVAGQELYLGEVEDMADAVLLGRPPRIGLGESRGNCVALLALLQSARDGRPVKIDGESALR